MSLAAKSIGAILASVAKRLIKDWAHKSARKRGEWRGEYAQEIPVDPEAAAQAGYPATRPCRLIVNSKDNPRHWVHESGVEYMFDTPLISDGGSTPEPARRACKEWADLEPFGRHREAFYFHDAAYRDAGCWVRMSGTNEWEWMRLTRAQADTLMFQMMGSSHGRKGEAHAIFHAVRVFGGRAWQGHRRRQNNVVR